MGKHPSFLDGQLGIDPQRLLFFDKRVVIIIRGAGLIFSIALAGLSILVDNGALEAAGLARDVSIPLALSIVALGIIEATWNPFTFRKVSAYIYAYMLEAILFSMLIFGFSTMMYLSWAILLMITVVFFGHKRTLAGYGLLIISFALWAIMRGDLLPIADLISHCITIMAVGILWLFTLSLWRLTNTTIQGIEAAKQKESTERSQLLALINSLNVAVVMVSPRGKIRLYNAAFLALIDTNVSLIGESLNDIVQLEDSTGNPVTKPLTATKQAFERDDLSMRVAEDDMIRLLISGAPIHSIRRHTPDGYVFVLRDITKTKSLEEERDEFISVISHELRTPVAITEGAVSNSMLLVERGMSTENLKPILKGAHDQVIYLADMINNLGTMSRAERGVGDSLEEINLDELMTGVYSKYLAEAKSKGLKLDLDIHSKLGTVMTSRLYLEEILQNLVTNAIKYTKNGGITIIGRRLPSGVELAVKDTGIGISRSDQKRLFEKFYRSEDYRTRETSGTGLGLYVTKKLASKLDTTIVIESRLNHGSTFKFVLSTNSKEKPSA